MEKYREKMPCLTQDRSWRDMLEMSKDSGTECFLYAFCRSATSDNIQILDLVPTVFTDETRSMVYDHRDGLHSTSLPKVSAVCTPHSPLQPKSSGTLSLH